MPSTPPMMISVEIGAAAPTPMATIDSPRAMMMIRPYRSLKCAGECRRQPAAPITWVPT